MFPKLISTEVRIGIHSGEVVGGVVGSKKWQFDLWGDHVEYANLMESEGVAGRINLSEAAYMQARTTPLFHFVCRHVKQNPKPDQKLSTSTEDDNNKDGENYSFTPFESPLHSEGVVVKMYLVEEHHQHDPQFGLPVWRAAVFQDEDENNCSKTKTGTSDGDDGRGHCHNRTTKGKWNPADNNGLHLRECVASPVSEVKMVATQMSAQVAGCSITPLTSATPSILGDEQARQRSATSRNRPSRLLGLFGRVGVGTAVIMDSYDNSKQHADAETVCDESAKKDRANSMLRPTVPPPKGVHCSNSAERRPNSIVPSQKSIAPLLPCAHVNSFDVAEAEESTKRGEWEQIRGHGNMSLAGRWRQLYPPLPGPQRRWTTGNGSVTAATVGSIGSIDGCSRVGDERCLDAGGGESNNGDNNDEFSGARSRSSTDTSTTSVRSRSSSRSSATSVQSVGSESSVLSLRIHHRTVDRAHTEVQRGSRNDKTYERVDDKATRLMKQDEQDKNGAAKKPSMPIKRREGAGIRKAGTSRRHSAPPGFVSAIV